MVKRVLAATAVFGFLWVIGGCVSMGTFEQKEKEAADYNKSLQELQQQYAALTKANADLTKANADLKAQVEKLTGTVAGLTKEKEKLAADNAQLDRLLKAKSDELSKNIADLRQKNAGLDSENARLKGENATLQKEVATLSGDIASLKKAKEEEVQKTSKTYEDMLEKMKSEISQGQVTISELKGKLTVNLVDAILFDSGKAEVKPEGLVVLQKVVDILKTVKDKAIRIEGHTDNKPISGALTKKYPTNWELSAARAINVARYLQQQGLDPTVLNAVAYGEHRPVADNDTDEGRARNRRIEIILVPKEAP
jgi:chemotaxis protein MotB